MTLKMESLLNVQVKASESAMGVSLTGLPESWPPLYFL